VVRDRFLFPAAGEMEEFRRSCFKAAEASILARLFVD